MDAVPYTQDGCASGEITMGSLFDGIGGFPLAAIDAGITPVWASVMRGIAMALRSA